MSLFFLLRPVRSYTAPATVTAVLDRIPGPKRRYKQEVHTVKHQWREDEAKKRRRRRRDHEIAFWAAVLEKIEEDDE